MERLQSEHAGQVRSDYECSGVPEIWVALDLSLWMSVSKFRLAGKALLVVSSLFRMLDSDGVIVQFEDLFARKQTSP